MSESQHGNESNVKPAGEAQANAKPAQEPAPPAPKKRRWRRRILRTLVVLIVAAVLLRIAIFFALGPVLRKVGAAYGLDLSFERQELTLLGGDVGLWYLKAVPAGGGTPLMRADYVRGSISAIELLKGRLRVERAEADGVDLTLERASDGSIPALRKLLDAMAGAPAAPPAGAAAAPIDFTPPLAVEAFRLQHVRARIRDAAVSPALDAFVAMDVRVSDVGSKQRPTRFDIDVWSDPVLDSLRISGEGKLDGRNLDGQARLFLRGLHPKPLAGYLAQLGLKPVGSSIAADLTAALEARPLAGSAAGVSANLVVENIRMVVDGEEAAGLGRLVVNASSITPEAARIGAVSVEGGRALALRADNGRLRMLGLELAGGAQSEPRSSASNSAPGYPVSLGELSVRDVKAEFRDQAISPQGRLQVALTELTAKGAESAGGAEPGAFPVRGTIALPGIVRSIRLEGTCKPFAATRTAELNVLAEGIRPDALQPYLALAGAESFIRDGQLQARVSLSLRSDPGGAAVADATLTGVNLRDGKDLLALESVKVIGAGVDPRTGRLRVEDAEISGPKLAIRRDSGGAIELAGVRIKQGGMRAAAPSAGVANPVATATRPSAGSILAALPRVQINRLAWKGMHIELRDEQTTPASVVAIDDAGVEMRDLVFDLQADGPGQPGTVSAWLAAPELAGRLSAEGTLKPRRSGLAAQIKLRGEGIHSETLARYLKPLGIEPTLQDGSAAMDADIDISADGDRLAGKLALSGIGVSDRGEELGGIDAVRIEGLSLSPGPLVEIKSLRIDRPRATVAREKDGALEALGVRIAMPAAQSPGGPATTAPASPPSTAPAGAGSFSAVCGEFRLNDAQVTWIDRTIVDARSQPVRATATVSVESDGIALAHPGAAPAAFRVRLSADDLVKELRISGKLDLAADTPSGQALVDGRGIRAGAMAAYFPPGVAATIEDGRLHALVEGRAGPCAEGGNALRLAVRDLDWHDGAEGPPLLGLQSLIVSAPRLDPEGGVFALDEITLAGLQVEAQLEPDGAIRAMGLSLKSGGAGAAAHSPATLPAEKQSPAPPASGDPGKGDVAQLVAEARRPLPMFTVEKLDLQVRRATLRDLWGAGSAPLALNDVTLRNLGRIELGGPDAENRPPIHLSLKGGIEPLVRSFAVDTETAPLAAEPSATVTVSAGGITGRGLTDLLPALRERIDGSALTDGQFQTRIQAHAKLDRRGAGRLDLSRGVELELTVTGTEFRDGPGGALLAGVEAIRAEQLKIEPETGRVAARSLEVTKPAATVFRDEQGLHAGGLVLRLPEGGSSPAEAEPATQPTAQAEPPETVAGPVPATSPAAPAAGGEMRVDRLTLSGLELRYEDRSVSPALLVPLNGLDVEARDLTTLALTENHPIRFTALVNSDKVPLPRAERRASSGIPGALGDVGALMSGKMKPAAAEEPTTRPLEDRELFSQLAASGRIALYPRPSGYVKTSLSGVELAAFSGLASQAGVQLSGGIFDGSVDARFREDGSLDTRSRLVLTDLALAEPQNGPIVRYLSLPAPLDAVIKAVEDPDGSINIPLHVALKDGELSGGAVAGAAVGALSSVLATAVASAPVKIAGGVGELVGLGAVMGSGKAPREPQTVALEFAPGSAATEGATRQALDRLIDQARRDDKLELTIRHELGAADVAVAAERANPSPKDCLALAGQLQSRKVRIQQERSELAGRVLAELASQPAGRARPGLEGLRRMDIELAELEDSLDQVYDLLRPGAERQATRRTRAASIQLGQERLDAVKQSLLGGGLSRAADRVHTTAVQFNPAESPGGGRVVITLIPRKK